MDGYTVSKQYYDKYFSSNSENPIDRSHLAMEGGPVSAKICLTCIFFWIDPPQFHHNYWGMFWEKAPFLSFPHLRRKSFLGSEILKAIGTPTILSVIITITSVIISSVVWRKRTRPFSSGCFLIFPTYWEYICCVKVVLHFLSRHVARQSPTSTVVWMVEWLPASCQQG